MTAGHFLVEPTADAVRERVRPFDGSSGAERR